MATGVLLDIDGVLVVSWKALPGAVEALAWVRSEDLPYRLVTNTSSKSRRQIARLLSGAGLPVAKDHVLTAVSSARRYLLERHPGAPCYVVNEGSLVEDLDGVELTGPDRAEVVLLGGAGPRTGYRELDAVFGLAARGVPVVAIHRNTRFQTASGPALDMGAFVIGLEAAAGIDIPVVGKPAPAFFRAALDDLGATASDTVMVGDDVVSDVLGAQAVGCTGVLVRTGKFRPEDLDPGLRDESPRPDHVINGVGDLPGLVRQLADGTG